MWSATIHDFSLAHWLEHNVPESSSRECRSPVKLPSPVSFWKYICIFIWLVWFLNDTEFKYSLKKKKSFSAFKDFHLVEGDGFRGQMLKLPEDNELEK